MISFGAAQTRFQNLSQDDSADALTFFKASYNVGLHILETELGSFFTEDTYTDLTEVGVFSYPTPDQFIRLKTAYVTISNVRYNMEQIFDEQQWQRLMSQTTGNTSDIPTHIFIRRDRFEMYPTPATAGNTITLIYEAGARDLYNDDYITGTITTLTNGAKAVTASGSTFTSNMVGRYFKIDAFPVWYKISAFGSTTTLTLDKEYQGVSIAAGTSSYTIGEMPRTPESTHQIPIWHGLMDYYQGFKQNESKATYYKNMYELDLKRAKVTFKKRYTSNYIPGSRRQRAINPNDYPTGMSY